MKIALDVMGFENNIKEAIIAAEKFKKKYRDVDIILIGDKDLIMPLLNRNKYEIIHTKEFIKQDDEVMTAIRKKNASLIKAIELVNQNKANALVSACSTASFVALTYAKIGIIENVTKPAFMPIFPTIKKNKIFNMLDVGANKNVSGKDLVNFAIMANIYAEKINKINKPKISLLNIGTEEYKGLDNIIEANNVLKNMPNINYQGYIEPRDLLFGIIDVIVCDGFIGNISLKTMEGTFKAVSKNMKENFRKPWNWLGGLFSLGAIYNLKKRFDYRNNAGAIYLGLKKIVIKTHGSADWKQFYSSLQLAYKSVNANLIKEIESSLK